MRDGRFREISGNLLLLLMAGALFLFTIGQMFEVWWFLLADWAKLPPGSDISGIKSRKDLFEASYYLSQIAILFVALVAGFMAYRQFREAEKARLASIYISMDEKWTSPSIVESRRLMHDVVAQCLLDPRYRGRMQHFPSLEAREALQDFAHEYLSVTKASNYDRYLKTMAIVDFLETFGMMVRKRYLNPNDIEPLIGMIVIAVHDIIGKHIAFDIERNQQINRLRGLTHAPKDYDNFVFLAGYFRRRFS